MRRPERARLPPERGRTAGRLTPTCTRMAYPSERARTECRETDKGRAGSRERVGVGVGFGAASVGRLGPPTHMFAAWWKRGWMEEDDAKGQGRDRGTGRNLDLDSVSMYVDFTNPIKSKMET